MLSKPVWLKLGSTNSNHSRGSNCTRGGFLAEEVTKGCRLSDARVFKKLSLYTNTWYIHQNYSVISFRYFLQNYLDSKEYQNRVPLKCRYYHFSCDFFDTFPKVVFSVSEYFAQRLIRPFDKNGQKKIWLSFWPSLSYFWPNFGVFDWISLAFWARIFP